MILDWFPAISTTSLLAIIIWLSRHIILERLKNSVRSEFDKDLENLKSNLRKSEDMLKADLKSKESQIDTLRSSIMSNASKRQLILYQEQVSAIKFFWEGVINLAPAKNICFMMANVNFDMAIKDAQSEPTVRKIFEIMGEQIDIKSIDSRNIYIQKPFLSQILWAYYSAYSAIIYNAILRMQFLQKGLDKDYTDLDKEIQFVKDALPEYEKYIIEHGQGAFHLLLDILESKMISEIQMTLKGDDADQESIQKAAIIQKAAERLRESND